MSLNSNSIHKDFAVFIRHLKLEALALAVLMLVLAYKSPYSMWWLLAAFPFVDLGMLGYGINPKVGAYTYNLLHNATLPTLLIAFGVLGNNDVMSFIGIVWTFHITIDRLLGYGLKHSHSFKETHLGRIGN